MGSTSSKFKKYLQHGDEFAAMQIYQSSPELRRNLDPNMSYGENHNHNTALHYAAKHGMKHLLRTFLNDLNGNPNKRNGINETVLHCACQLNQSKSFGAQERRAACVQLLLYWKGAALPNGTREKVDLSAQDKTGNTALHYASITGLKRCVELLLAHGSPLFAENDDKFTPCDVAMKASHHDIARLLESRMVFADNPDVINEDEILLEKEVYSGLRSQDLQEAKDQLLVDTSDMLKIPLFTAEALLRNNEWSREVLLEKWMKNPVDCCQLAGVQAPNTVLNQGGSLDSSTSPESDDPTSAQPDIMCEICYIVITSSEHRIHMSCKHFFCSICWERYLTCKIQDGDAHHILCPAYQCHILVPVEFIEKLVSPEMARRYLQFDIKAFVDSNKSIKWCPIAGCGRAVRLPEAEQFRQDNHKLVPITSHAVDCGNAHFFCWECLGEAHAPSGCQQWQEWQIKIGEVKPEELQASCSGSEDAANFLWLVTNAKPCPNCKSPIQKNEGCNHMKCSKCKYDFCWVCQESWKRHSSATGGYFRCNRFEAVHKADERQGSLITDALDRNNQMQEMSRFLHFYTRFRNHENSQRLEEPLLLGVQRKMEILSNSFGNQDMRREPCERSTKFIEDGVRELLKARRILCGSYVYGFYIEDDGYNKSIFEFMQNELEEVTEKLSEMIARPYLRTPKTVIVQTTLLARRKRHEFLRAVAQGLIPPETPPVQRKTRKRRYLDTELSQSAVWLHDCNWPQYDSENEETDPGYKCSQSLNSPKKHECNLRCSKHGCGKAVSDCNMELVIALEMSRLQMIEDRMKQAQSQRQMQNQREPNNNPSTTAITPDPSSSISNNSNESSGDDQLKLAIQLSLQENRCRLADVEQNNCQTYIDQANADITVDYFLKSLANHKIDLCQLGGPSSGYDSSSHQGPVSDCAYKWYSRGVGEFRDPCLLFKSCRGNEDGRFQISDIHENGFTFGGLNEEFDDDRRLKRSHSTGDIRSKRFSRLNGNYHRTGISKIYEAPSNDKSAITSTDDPSSQLDSDYSCSHADKQIVSRKMIPLPIDSSMPTDNANACNREEFADCGPQSSVEETTTSDSINADDMEVCGILESLTDEDIGSKVYSEDECRLYVNVKVVTKKKIIPADSKTAANRKSAQDSASTKKQPNAFVASLKAKLCSAHLPGRSSLQSRVAVNRSIGLLSNKAKNSDNECGVRTNSPSNDMRRNTPHEIQQHRRKSTHDEESEEPQNNGNTIKDLQREKQNLFSKSTGYLNNNGDKSTAYTFMNKNVCSNLRIKICKSPDPKCSKTRVLETDSSNEYESETGIPKSPTLFISGVSISRTPEPKSPGISLVANNGRQSRSSSLSVPVPLTTCALNISTSSLNSSQYHPSHNLSTFSAATPATSTASYHATTGNPIASVSSTTVSANNTMPSNYPPEPFTPSLVRSTTPLLLTAAPSPSKHSLHASGHHPVSPPSQTSPCSSSAGSGTANKENKSTTKSKSASEPEREREMFRFPKSSTDGALSSVLHVQESNLSSDDFHEALFLLERSPKTRDSKRRKKSKRKDKEKPDEASSAL